MRKKIITGLFLIIGLLSTNLSYSEDKICFEFETDAKTAKVLVNEYKLYTKLLTKEPNGEGIWVYQVNPKVPIPKDVKFKIIRQKGCKIYKNQEKMNLLATQTQLGKVVFDKIAAARVREEYNKKNLTELIRKYQSVKDNGKQKILELFRDKEFEKLLSDIDKRRENLDVYMREMNNLNKLYGLFGQRNFNSNNDVARLNKYRQDLIKSMLEFSEKLQSDYILSKSKDVDKDIKSGNFKNLNYKQLSLYKFSQMLKAMDKDSPNLADNYYNLYLLMNENTNALDYTSKVLNNVSRNLSFDELELMRKKQSKSQKITRENARIGSSFEGSINMLDRYEKGNYKNLSKEEIKKIKEHYEGPTLDDLLNELWE